MSYLKLTLVIPSVLTLNPSCVAKNINIGTSQRLVQKADVVELSSKAVSPSTLKAAARAQSAVVVTSKTTKTAEDLDAIIDSLLPAKNKDKNPLKGTGAAFLEMGEKYDINPITLISIAMLESGRGTSSAARLKHNVGGIMGKKGLREFKTTRECIEIMAHTLKKAVNKGKTTIDQIGHAGCYCEKRYAANWIKGVKSFIIKIENSPAK